MKYHILFILILFLAAPVWSWAVTIDQTTDTCIVWNISGRPANETIQYVSLDGIVQTAFDGNSSTVIQSSLLPNETHMIRVVTNVSTTGNTTTTTSTTDFAVWQILVVYCWAIASVALMIIGLKWIKISCLLSLFPALIGLVTSIEPTVTMSFASIRFWIYVILIIIGFVFYALLCMENR